MHRFDVRIYYEDTDFSGNVYHAAYLKFMERARTEVLRENDIHHFELARQGMAFAVAKLEVSYLRPAHIDDRLQVKTRIRTVRGARLIMEQVICRDGETLVEASVVVAAIGPGGRAVRLPLDLVKRLGGK